MKFYEFRYGQGYEKYAMVLANSVANAKKGYKELVGNFSSNVANPEILKQDKALREIRERLIYARYENTTDLMLKVNKEMEIFKEENKEYTVLIME